MGSCVIIYYDGGVEAVEVYPRGSAKERYIIATGTRKAPCLGCYKWQHPSGSNKDIAGVAPCPSFFIKEGYMEAIFIIFAILIIGLVGHALDRDSNDIGF